MKSDQPRIISLTVTPELIETLSDSAVTQLTVALRHMHHQLDETLYGYANRATSSANQTRFYESLLIMQDSQEAVTQAFAQSIARGFKRFIEARTALDTTEHDESATLDPILTAMANRTRDHHQAALMQLSTRLSTYFTDTIPDIDNPLDPQQIVVAYSNAIEQLALAEKVRLIVLKDFERHVLRELGPVYQQLNSSLRDARVMPNLSSNMTSTSGDFIPDTNSALPSFAELQSLLDASANKAIPAPNPRLVLTHLQLDALLNNLQRRHTSIRQGLTESLQASASEADSPNLSPQDDHTIQLVELMFEFISEQDLPLPIAELVNRLQIPVIKIALRGPTLFDDPQHPLRRLINDITESALGWNGGKHYAQDPLYQTIEKSITAVQQTEPTNTPKLEHIATEFQQFYQAEQNQAERAIERAASQEEGRASQASAQEHADDTVEWYISDRFLPPAIIRFAKGPWHKYLVHTYLQQGRKSPDWQEASNTLEDLVWSVTDPLDSADSRLHWKALLPQLGKQLRKGVETVSHSPSETEHYLSELWGIHRKISQGQGKDMDRIRITAVAHKAARPVAAVSPKAAANLQIANDLPMGTWVEFTQGNTSKLICRLVRRIQANSDFVFATRYGTQTLAIGAQQLAGYLHNQSARVLENAPLMDRALYAILGRLKDQQPVVY